MADGLGRIARGRVARRGIAALAGAVLAASLGCASAPAPAPAPPPTPAPADEAAAAPTADAPATHPGPEPGGDVLVLAADDLFVEGSAELTSAGRERLQAVAAELASRGPSRVVVRAHTDDDGSVAFNYSLSDQRAEAVRIELVADGLDGSLVRARGLGPKYPVAPNDTPEGRARNRRVTLETRAPAWQPSGVSP